MSTIDAYELAYREAVRALEQQRAAVTELRGRASALIATASITMSLLGPTVFTSAPLGWLAVGCFTLLSVCVIAVIWPTRDWRSTSDPRGLLTTNSADLSDTEPASGPIVAIQLIAHMAEDRAVNAAHLARVVGAFRAATCLLAAHLIFAVAAATATT